MTTLKVGIADYKEMKARSLRIARGEEKLVANDPKVWFSSTEAFAKLLSAGNRELLRTIDERAPGSLDELAEMTGRKKSNLSRTLKAMAGHGLIRMERRAGRRLAPRLMYDRVELHLPLIKRAKARKRSGGER